jgi:membrane-associated phospholipid phosphatase
MPNVLDRRRGQPRPTEPTGGADLPGGDVPPEDDRSEDVAPREGAADGRTALARALPFVGAGTAFLVAFIVVYVVGVLGETAQRIENLALLGAAIRSESDRGQSVGALSPISVATFAFALVGVVIVGFVRRRPGLGVLAATVMLIAVLAAELLKDVLPRPSLVTGPVWLLRNSFPSGTVAVATATAVGALIVSPDRLRWAVLVACCVGVAIVAQATQVAGWHRLSDVLGSALLVVAVGSFGVGALATIDLVAPSTVGRVDPRVYAALLVGAAALLALGALLLVLLIAFPLLSTPDGGRRAFLQTAFPLFAAALTALPLLLFARLLEQRSLGQRLEP